MYIFTPDLRVRICADNITMIQGRLGNLGRIDDKYDVAISTACGAGLDNLVTDTIAGGQLCIEHLRKNDLGRASVMCLDRINSRDMRPIQTPENAPRLFDLITMKDPKYASAFFQIIHNTLVAPDLEQANRIAFPTDPNAKRWRVVTLDGKVIDTSGTMSGGGGRPAKGGMSSKITNDDVSPEVVARCEKEREVAVEALRVFGDERERVEKDLNQVKMRLPEIGLDMEKLEMELKTGGKRMEEAEKRFAELK
jgi:structural maintenance of chromosome 4